MFAREDAAYTQTMDAPGVTAERKGMEAELVERVVALDPAEHLEAVYRDYPGLRALIMRRVRDPELAADILQDAAVTTLEKLRAGVIARPDGVGGYLYRVALNHLRNHRRKDRAPVSSAEALEELPDDDEEAQWRAVGRDQWASVARRTLEELPTARDREILVRFYLHDEPKDDICASLRLSAQHFNRVVFRARNRFRTLLEQRGYISLDALALLTLLVFEAARGMGLA